jgi:Transposase DDE domain group 1
VNNPAVVEDRIRCANETGLENLPFRNFAGNQVWLELVLTAQDLLVFYQRLCLEGEACNWQPKKLRYRLLHTVGRMIRTGRRQLLRLQTQLALDGSSAGGLQAVALAARHHLSWRQTPPPLLDSSSCLSSLACCVCQPSCNSAARPRRSATCLSSPR